MTACTHPVYRPGRASHSRQLGALMRAGGNLLLTGLRRLYGRQVKRSSSLFRQVAMLARGTGPGLNSGLMLDEMLGSALANKTGDADITLGDVQRRFGKRLVIIVTELTSGKERQLTPETHADLPLRIAVRMSMGVPGLMEPVRYNGHLYCDGGVTNDFPMATAADLEPAMAGEPSVRSKCRAAVERPCSARRTAAEHVLSQSALDWQTMARVPCRTITKQHCAS